MYIYLVIFRVLDKWVVSILLFFISVKSVRDF